MNPSQKIRIELYSKPGCHLCDDAKIMLEEAKTYCDLEIKVTNIEEDAALFKRYQYDIPVILINGRKAFKHKVCAIQLKERIEREK